MDITAQFKKVIVLINRNGFVSSLKEMSAPLFAPIDIICIRAIDVMHHLGQIRFRGLQDEVIMLCEAPDYVKFTSLL